MEEIWDGFRGRFIDKEYIVHSTYYNLGKVRLREFYERRIGRFYYLTGNLGYIYTVIHRDGARYKTLKIDLLSNM